MLFEGTGIYFLLLFLVFLVVYITVRICVGKLLKKAKVNTWMRYLPIYSGLLLTDVLELKKSIFFMSLIPFVNLYYYNIMIKEMLKGFGMSDKGSIWFIILPMYKFPELVFKNPKFIKNEYDLTEGFLDTQEALYSKEEPIKEPIEEPKVENNQGLVINPVNYQAPLDQNTYTEQSANNASQTPLNQVYPKQNINNTPLQPTYQTGPETVFTNQNLEPDERHETVVEVHEEEKKEEKPIITPLETGRPKMCPNCGAKLSPGASVCFLCGTKLE